MILPKSLRFLTILQEGALTAFVLGYLFKDVYVCVCVIVNVCVYVYVYMYMHIYMHDVANSFGW